MPTDKRPRYTPGLFDTGQRVYSPVNPPPGASPWLEEIRTADYTNATTTGTDVFTGFTPAANTRYMVDVLLMVQSAAATTGIQTALLGPAAGITRSAVKINSASAAGTDLVTHTVVGTYQAAVASLTTPTLLYIQALVTVGATPAVGNIRVAARSEAALSTVTVWPGSSMRWRVI